MEKPKLSDWTLSPHDCTGYLRTMKTGEHRRDHQVSWTETIFMNVPTRFGLINLTEKIEEILMRSKVIDGLCYIGAMHITAGIYVNDAESGLLQDISKWIEELAPFNPSYRHHQTGEDNGDAHLKSFLTNHQIVVPVTKGQFDFGTWQLIFYAEYDGRREKRILVKISGLS